MGALMTLARSALKARKTTVLPWGTRMARAQSQWGWSVRACHAPPLTCASTATTLRP